jgi:hypothetical protein
MGAYPPETSLPRYSERIDCQTAGTLQQESRFQELKSVDFIAQEFHLELLEEVLDVERRL